MGADDDRGIRPDHGRRVQAGRGLRELFGPDSAGEPRTQSRASDLPAPGGLEAGSSLTDRRRDRAFPCCDLGQPLPEAWDAQKQMLAVDQGCLNPE